MREIAAFLRAHRSFVILGHVDPDGDAIGSALGLAGMLRAEGRVARVALPGGVPDTYRFLPRTDEVGASLEDVDPEAEAVVVLDSTSPSRLANLAPLTDGTRPLANVDHHPDNSRFGAPSFVDPTACATALLLYELARDHDFAIDAEVASCLYTGIVTDTGRFTFSNTDARGLAAAAELTRLGAEASRIATRVYATHTPSSLRLLGAVLATLELHEQGRVACVQVTNRMLEECGATSEDADGFSGLARSVEGVSVGLFFRETEGGTKVSFRSNGGVSIHGVASRFGGGGHSSASGARLPFPLEEAKARVLVAVAEHLESLV